MAVFIRQDAKAGDSALRTLATGEDVYAVADAATVVKIKDGDLVGMSGIYSSESSSRFLATSRSRRSQTARTSSPRQLVFKFATGDHTGYEQAALKSFFTYDRRIAFYDRRAKISEITFFVVSIDDDFFSGVDTIAITAQAEYDDLMNKKEAELFKAENQSSFPAISVAYTNESSIDASIRLHIETADGSVAPIARSSITMKSDSAVSYASGQITAATGDYTGTSFTESAFVLDSTDEIVSGHGFIDPMNRNRFFTIPPSTSTTITVTASAMPISGGKIRLTAFQTAPRGMYAPSFTVASSGDDE